MTTSADNNSPLAVWEADMPPEEIVFGHSKCMVEVRQEIERVAFADVPLLIRGESGTGKEVMARHIHRRQFGPSTPFIRVKTLKEWNSFLKDVKAEMLKCLASDSASSHLHGTQMARQCTLFIDEVADLTPDWQSKLKQFLQEEPLRIQAEGKDESIRVRFICASNRPLEKEVETHRLRKDLFYCIDVVSFLLPPLRARRADIPNLVNYFMEIYRTKFNRSTPAPSSRTIGQLQRYPWPGNVRELENLIKRFVLLGSEGILREVTKGAIRNVERHAVARTEPVSLKALTRQATRDLERKLILKVLREYQGNRTHAARALNISYRALLYKIKESGMPPRWHSQEGTPNGVNVSPEIQADRNLNEGELVCRQGNV